MSKPKWLKTSYLKARLAQTVCSHFPAKGNSSTNHVLITSTDGLGDTFLRLSLVLDVCNQYGFDNVWILTKGHSAPIYERLGVQTILYSDRMRTSVSKRLGLLRKIDLIGFHSMYCFEFIRNEDLAELIKLPIKIGFNNPYIPLHDTMVDKVVDNPGYVGDALINMQSQLNLSTTTPLMDNQLTLSKQLSTCHRPNNIPVDHLRVLFAVGAADKARMMRISNITKLLGKALEAYSDIRIELIGSGERDKYYADQIMDSLKSPRLSSLISQWSILETTEQVSAADIVIGFDSGIYNLAFTLKKPTLCLAAENQRVLHHVNWVRIAVGTDKEFGIPDSYGCIRTNSISEQDFTKLFEELVLLATSNNQQAEPKHSGL
ncbi:hypothetical protein L1D26_24240 [Vibrio mediterranei]|uniref:glycosyltransferase family 9 protein n=1 Tax=Vibrio mediterranei TaxID=689 RepID=UPI001EFD6106|nr:hypothetical protein [Vibrio mediterranei]